jgi:hypothetical protein
MTSSPFSSSTNFATTRLQISESSLKWSRSIVRRAELVGELLVDLHGLVMDAVGFLERDEELRPVEAVRGLHGGRGRLRKAARGVGGPLGRVDPVDGQRELLPVDLDRDADAHQHTVR